MSSCDFYMKVERGPRWLAELLYCNQDIMAPILGVAFLALLGFIGYAISSWEIKDEERRDMVRNSSIVLSIAAGTVLMTHVTNSYPIVVVGGVVIGYGFWLFLLGPRIIKSFE